MVLLRQQGPAQPGRALPYPTAWQCATFGVRRTEEAEQAAEELAVAMAAAGYPSQHIFGTRRALQETLRGAVGLGRSAGEVRVGYAVTPLEVRVEVEGPAPAGGKPAAAPAGAAD
jgi:hypothetical protein